ncbi:MAG: 3-isopropylmalate dehydratase small subunit [Deltaproteobacteria bacterium]|nr:3-isopropylmalate dehydratase small subunit [Deltaproteobacteria bacterium]MBW1961085.1 3-isopropylmalate dehydratase small subunit [Deltaproteobacteria bacterium]MBW1994022.1 3-isopropylmalate dehydratase small subunit [Deltaproteobacteria bacterium]MBW2150497.1 3-isopropylmalate dehydratase small subunit [Deltaproteobacteria bacterium]
MIIRGRVWKYGDDISTDVIFPGKYTYTIHDPLEMAAHSLEGLDPDFAEKVQKGDVLVGGKNFGCGSSREQAATCLKFSGIGAVVAKSFGRIFFRNAINNGLPLVQCAQAVDVIENGETVCIDIEKGELECSGGKFTFTPLPGFMLEILADGGLIPHTKKKIGR